MNSNVVRKSKGKTDSIQHQEEVYLEIPRKWHDLYDGVGQLSFVGEKGGHY